MVKTARKMELAAMVLWAGAGPAMAGDYTFCLMTNRVADDAGVL